jgi:hypothetical protein
MEVFLLTTSRYGKKMPIKTLKVIYRQPQFLVFRKL